ncbi:MAG: MoxR family ATPase, partial [Clostridia bacterium]
MEEIINVHFGNIDQKLCQKALEAFYEIRKMDEIQKKPSTSELLDWIQALMISGVDIENLSSEMPFVGVLLKKNQDIDVMHEIKEKGYSLKRW